MDPCGRPVVTCLHSEQALLVIICCLRPGRSEPVFNGQDRQAKKKVNLMGMHGATHHS